MKLIARIALNEFRYYFYAPIGWFVLICFLFLFGGVFMLAIYNNTYTQEIMMSTTSGQWKGFVGDSVTKDRVGITFQSMGGLFYLFIPLITMNLINKEYNSGTIRLINSSPVSSIKFVLGKYLGVLLFLLMILSLFFLIVLVGVSRIENADYPYFFSATLMFVMQALIFVAIGMFLSSVTSYPIVAACATFVVLLVLSNLHGTFQKYDGFRELFYFLSTKGRAANFLNGLITSRDILYHFIVACLFITFTIIHINSQFRSRKLIKAVSRYIGAAAIAALLIFIVSMRGNVWYYDATRIQENTASVETQAALVKLDGSPLKITLYTNLLGYHADKGIPDNRSTYVWGFWERYFRFYENIEFNYEYYYDTAVGDSSIFKQYPNKTLKDIATKMAEALETDIGLFDTPEQISEKIDLSAEVKGLLFTITYKDKTVLVRTYSDTDCWPTDIHMAAAFQYLVVDTLPRFKFLTGHYERSPYSFGERNYGTAVGDLRGRKSIVNYYLMSDLITDVHPSTFNREDVLVIADPKTELPNDIIDSVCAFIDQGGNAILFSEPNKQHIINPILHRIGATIEPGTLVWSNPQDLGVKFNLNHTKTIHRLANEQELYLYKHQLIDSVFGDVHSTSYIRQTNEDFQMDTIFYINSAYYDPWVQLGKVVTDSAMPVFDGSAGQYKLATNYLVAADFKRTINNKEQRVIVSADADFMSNIRFASMKIGAAYYSYSVANNYPPYHNLDLPTDIFMKGTAQTAGILAKTLGLFLPLFLLIAAIIILVRRKRK